MNQSLPERHFCPTCLTKRPSVNHQCAVCGGPVRLGPLPRR